MSIKDLKPTMDIYSPKGTKVKFLGFNGHETELESAKQLLEIGQLLTVKRIERVIRVKEEFI